MTTLEQDASTAIEYEIGPGHSSQNIIRRIFSIQKHLLGLLFGGGFAYLRYRKAAGLANGVGVLFLRLVLICVRPFLDKQIIQQPFPIQFRLRLEALGPTYIKLGQILSLREDLLPKSITSELQNLLDRLPVVPFPQYMELVQEALGAPPEFAFVWINSHPSGSASLAQIHRARLRTGEEVVLKVIKPGVREMVHQDCQLLQVVGALLQIFFARYQPRRLINEFCAYTEREVDLRFEAENAETFAANFADDPNICFPKVYREFSGRDMLCMEFFDGVKPDATAAAQFTPAERSRIVDLGVGSIIRMIFRDGFFHADLHPGNLIIFEDGQVGFIDLGMVGRLDDETRRGMLYYFYSLVMGDASNAARILVSMAILEEGGDAEGFRRSVEALNERWIRAANFKDFSIAQLVLRSIASAGRYRIYYPEAIILMVKALVTVEGVGNLLAPELTLTQASRKHLHKLLLYQFSPATLLRQALTLAPETLDILLRSPVVLSQELQWYTKQSRRPRTNMLSGVKEIILSGFCLVAGAILASFGGPWPVWGSLFVVALLLALRGIR